MAETIADLIENRFGLPATAGRNTPASGTIAGMVARRSHRRFKPDPVSQETLEIVLAAALSSPAKSDLQQASIVIVRDAAQRGAINGLVES
ncbi:MAG: nitroreductase family protein, partial [Burkholderiales bacterium]